MPATNQAATWQDMASKLKTMGGVTSADIGEPMKGVQPGMVAIIAESGSIDETVLNAPRELHTVTLRRYEDAVAKTPRERDLALDRWRAEILEDVFGDFELGGTIAYPLPLQCRWDYGYQTVENHIFRLLDVTVVYRVDPTATFVA